MIDERISSRMPELFKISPWRPGTAAPPNLLTALIRAETVAEAGPEPLPQDQCDQLWNGYLGKHKIENDEQLASHLQTSDWMPTLCTGSWSRCESSTARSSSSTRLKRAFWPKKNSSTEWCTACFACATASWLGALLHAGQEANFADLAAEHSQGRKPKQRNRALFP